MDPAVCIIVTAFAQALGNLANPAVKDAYDGLKVLIKRKFADKPEVLVTVDQYESNPDSWGGALESSLAAADASEDAKIMTAAQQVLDAVQSAQTTIGGDALQDNARKYVHSGQGDVNTDNARKIDTGGGSYVENQQVNNVNELNVDDGGQVNFNG